MSPYRDFFVFAKAHHGRNTDIINHHILPVNIFYKSINHSEIGANTAPPHHKHILLYVLYVCIYIYVMRYIPVNVRFNLRK